MFIVVLFFINVVCAQRFISTSDTTFTLNGVPHFISGLTYLEKTMLTTENPNVTAAAFTNTLSTGGFMSTDLQ